MHRRPPPIPLLPREREDSFSDVEASEADRVYDKVASTVNLVNPFSPIRETQFIAKQKLEQDVGTVSLSQQWIEMYASERGIQLPGPFRELSPEWRSLLMELMVSRPLNSLKEQPSSIDKRVKDQIVQLEDMAESMYTNIRDLRAALDRRPNLLCGVSKYILAYLAIFGLALLNMGLLLTVLFKSVACHVLNLGDDDNG